MENLIVTLTGNLRTREYNGRRYIVAPLSLIVPGVLSGTQGPLYYPPEEVSKDPAIWNHMPIVVNHPEVDGKHVSARSVAVLNKSQIGVVFNSRYENNRLVAEGWFDVEATQRVDNRIFFALQRNAKLELSTGLFTRNDPVENGKNFNGKDYTAIARDHKPDHLAILPDAKGACSLADGCGVNVNKQGLKKLIGDTGQNDDHSHNLEITEDGFGFTSFEEGHSHLVEDFVVQEADGHTHSLDKNSLVDSSIRNRKGNDIMTNTERKEIVTDLVTNCECWEEGDRETLMKLDDEKLTKVSNYSKQHREQEAVANAAKEGFEDQVGNAHTFNAETNKWESKIKEETTKPVVNKLGDKTGEQEIEKQDLQIKLEDLPAEMQEDIQFSRNAKKKHKEMLVENLVANIEDDSIKSLQKERLLSRNLGELEEDVKLLPKPAANKETEEATVNYFGQSAPAVDREQIRKPTPLGQPVWNFDPVKESVTA